MRMAVGAKSHVGLARSSNEDAFLTKEPLFVVADGMGGHLAGDVASSTAVSTIEDHFSEASADEPETLTRLVQSANQAIWRKAQADASLRGMGTTCTLLYVDGPKAYIAHVGDSRAYRLRGDVLQQLTEDHTLVARMVKEGKLRAEDAERHPQRSIITRALGVDSDVSVDLISIEIEADDRLLLCSDGLSSMLDHDSIEEVLAGESDPQVAAELLVDLANEAGGEDNVTVVIVDFSSDDRSAEAEPPPEPVARRDTPAEMPPEVHVAGRGRRWFRRLTGLLVLAALAGVGIGGAAYALQHSWFVGVNEQGVVTIYRGIPEKIAGVSFKEEHEVTNVALEDLPGWKRSDVRDEMKFDSLEEARTNVSNLERISREFARPSAAEPQGS
jgi:serine/threonine protein phosphatase PrpC